MSKKRRKRKPAPHVVKIEVPARRNEPKPITMEFQARDWYEFCTRRHGEYLSRNMLTAAMIYWCMRWWGGDTFDMPGIDLFDLTTEEGFEENVSSYLEYKLETTPHMFD